MSASKPHLLLRALSPRIVARVIDALDQSTVWVVATAWVAALLISIMAAYTVHTAVVIKKADSAAESAQPVMPATSSIAVNGHEAQQIIERLQRQFPDIKFELSANSAIVIRSIDGSKFHQWIDAATYLDSIEPQLHWSIRDFCVGHCGGDIMKITVSGQHIAFSLPPPSAK